MKLNIGCGLMKLEEYVNVDIDPKVEPDAVFDFTGIWPYPSNSIEKIVCYHTLEHIQKFRHDSFYAEAHRVLETDGLLVISFPEFEVCSRYWSENKRGMRDFWEATIFGRQASPHDFHVCIMNRELVSHQLVGHGFRIEYCGTEPIEDFNSVIKARKDVRFTYEDALKETVGV